MEFTLVISAKNLKITGLPNLEFLLSVQKRYLYLSITYDSSVYQIFLNGNNSTTKLNGNNSTSKVFHTYGPGGLPGGH